MFAADADCFWPPKGMFGSTLSRLPHKTRQIGVRLGRVRLFLLKLLRAGADNQGVEENVPMSSILQFHVPRRVLVVDHDQQVRESVRALLAAADIEVVVAADGEEALTLLGRQSFPLVVTDRSMPVIDGFEFVQRLRAISVAPVYVIMLSANGDAHDLERGYCAGVDHYISKKGFESHLVAKVTTGMAAIRRRHVTGAGRPDDPVTVDLESGAHTARHLVGRLHAEIAYTARLKKPLSVLSVCIEPGNNDGAVGAAASEALLQSVYSVVRPKLDWIARLPAGNKAYRLAIIMPSATALDVSAVETGIRNAFVRSSGESAGRQLKLSMGSTVLTGNETSPPTALELLGESERVRRGLGKPTPAEAKQVDIRTVQGGGEVEKIEAAAGANEKAVVEAAAPAETVAS